ncbi:MAG: T9SS type A sorting domain-containing protein [Paludibacter sp.]
MKKTLLLSALAFIVILGLNAQTTIWNMGGDPTVAAAGSPAWPLSAGLASGVLNGTVVTPGGTETINGLTITTGAVVTTTPCGVVSASVKSFTSPTTTKAYAFVNKFLLNGAGYTGAVNTDVTPTLKMPTQKYASFQVSGNSTVYMIGITGSSSSARKMFLTDGTNLIGSGIDFPAGTNLSEGTITYTGPATTLYLFGNASVALYYLSATGVVIAGVNQVLSDKGVSYNGIEIVNSKGLDIEVYNMLGKRVATSKTNIPTTNLPKGIYVVRASGINESLKISI